MACAKMDTVRDKVYQTLTDTYKRPEWANSVAISQHLKNFKEGVQSLVNHERVQHAQSKLIHTISDPSFQKALLVISLIFNFGLIAMLNSRMYSKVHAPIAVREEVSKWPQHTLCIYFEGGLGNHLFQYASAYGIAKSKNMGLVIDRRSYILTLFDMRPSPLTYNHVCECSRRKVIVEEKPCRFDPHVYDFRSNRDYRIRNFLQSWKYFENVIDDIKKQYVIRKPFVDRGTEILRQSVAKHYDDSGDVVPDDLVFVGLHIRRGDYLKREKKLYGYRTAPKHYIFKSMQYFRDRYPHVIFVVCSNDLKWTKAVLAGTDDAIFMTGNEREIDFAILTSMNHSITTVGTFSWWSAFLANGTVIYFRHFVVPNSQLRNEFSADFSDFFLPYWIAM